MNVLLELLILLLLARVFGETAERVGQPSAVGELSAGVLVAAAAALWGSAIPIFSQLTTSKTLEDFAQLGIFFLVLLAGVESKLEELRQNFRSATFVALGGALVPMIAGFILGWLFLPESEVRSIQAFLIGLTMSITSIPATIKVLSEFKLLHTRMGQTTVGAAIVDDIIGIFLLAILTSMIQTGHIAEPVAFALLLGKVILFFGITISLGIHVYPRV
ncbi:MAG: cation:proton antiporter, partial [Nitrospirales bacterium]